MNRYRTYGQMENPPLDAGDPGFVGVDQYTTPENLPPGVAQDAVNMDFTSGDAKTRGGFVCIPELGSAPFGSDWTSRTSAADNDWLSVTYGNGMFVAVSNTGTGNRIMTSPDGVTWTSRTNPVDNHWTSVTFGGGLFVAVSNTGTGDRVMTSSDGITWTSRTSASDNDWRAVTWGNGLFVAVASSGTGDRVMTSPDGITWTSRTSAADNSWVGVAYANGMYVAVSSTGTGNRVMTSTNGTTWTSRTSLADSSWRSVTYGNGRFVAVANSGAGARIMISSDGITWTAPSETISGSWLGVAYGANVFIAVAGDGTVILSHDGDTWLTETSAPDRSWQAIAFGDNRFVIVGATGSGDRVATRDGRTVWASGSFSDPSDIGSQWTMLVGSTAVGFYAFGKTSRSVSYTSGETVSVQSTVVQANNYVFIFRGPDETPLRWDGVWGNDFELAPTPTPSPGFGIIPNSDQAVYAQNRLWVKSGKDFIAASDLLDFTAFDDIYQTFSTNIGNSDYVVTTYPFGLETLIEFKSKSIYALQNCAGDLDDVVATELTRQAGAIGINAVTSVGPDLVYVSDRNINLLSLTSTNNALQHKTLPLSQAIQKIFDRVNWEVGSKISLGYWNNKLYVALPLDNSTVCNSVVVYNFITEHWFGEWHFDSSLGVAIQGWVIGTYLGLQRIMAVTEDGRLFVINEGRHDISGNLVVPISTSLTTRPYKTDDNQNFSRRFVLDISTNAPTFSITAYTSAEGYSQTLITDRTYLRSQTWKFNDSEYDMTNANDDYNRPWRKDYSAFPDEEIEPQSGFNPNVFQTVRLPLMARMRGRLMHVKLTNTTGVIIANGISLEAIPGDRQNYPQLG